MQDSIPISELLNLAAGGDSGAEEKVFSAVYEQLRRLAAAQRARLPAGDTLDTTAVVHEAYLRLVESKRVSWNGRHHFFCTAARSMRNLLIDEARRKGAGKRGGGLRPVTLDDAVRVDEASPEDLLALDEALSKLEQEDAGDFQVVMLRYFAGLTVAETADVLGLSQRNVERRWRFCRSWLARELGQPGAES